MLKFKEICDHHILINHYNSNIKVRHPVDYTTASQQISKSKNYIL